MLSSLFEEYKKLSRRYERKFTVADTNWKYFGIEQLVKIHPAGFREIYYRRRINNIYIDTLGFDNYYDNLFGNYQRLKVRIRWYGETYGIIGNPILEFKIKSNDLGAKMSIPLCSFDFNNNFDISELQKIILESNIPLTLMNSLKVLKPTLLNNYWRKYYLSFDGKYRLCLDDSLKYYFLNENNRNFHNDYDKVVVELKYSENDHDNADWITNNLPLRLAKKSKYVSGIQYLYEYG